MGYNVVRFESYDITKGLRPNKSNLSPEIVQSSESTNITSGIQLGTSPRYGMAPIPGHSHTDSVNTSPVGLMQSESNTGTNRYKDRLRVLGLVPVTLGEFADVSSKKVHYVWIVCDVNSRIHFVFAGDYTGTLYRHLPDIAAGLQPQPDYLFQSPSSFLDPLFWHFPLRDSTALGDLNKFLTVKNNVHYCSVTSLTVSGKDVPMQFVAGSAKTTPNATTTALPTFARPTSGTNHFMGLPSFFNTRNFNDSVRELKFFNLDVSGKLQAEYDYSISPDSSMFQATFNQSNSTPNIGSQVGSGTLVPRLDGVAPSYAAVTTVLYNDPQSTTNSGYTAIAAACGKAVMQVVQDWQRNSDGTLNQYIDPCNPVFIPLTRNTLDGAGSYKENGISINSAFAVWPSFTNNTPLVKNSVAAKNGLIHVTLGDANSGILRSNSTYEFSFSIYDKQFNLESNVGQPAKILTSTDDFVSISFLRDAETGGLAAQQNAFAYQAYVPLPLTFNTDATPANTPLNYLEYRIYYRQVGSFEWLPAMRIDAAKYWYYPNERVLWACEGAIASLPGGQPGAFSDYSPLPKDGYTDVKVFQNRMFWLSAQNLVFSNQNNVFAYALRNSVPCPNGEFRGMIIHYFFGEAQQYGRVVVFGSKETYSGTFTGNPITSPIQISANNVATFPLDGSDFILDTRTSITAFSSRAAIVAEGKLFFWGPTGIYFDDGVRIPEKVSSGIEPDILNLYDPNKTEEIHAQYLEETKELIWFYTKKGDTSGLSVGLVYNPITGEFFNVSFNGKIDWANKIPIDKGTAERNTSGTRNIIGLRGDASQSVQRAVFFDYRNRSGDFVPSHELLVKQVSLPDARTLRFYLAGGYSSIAFNNVAVGSKLCVQQGSDYSNQTNIKDILTQISGKGGTFPNQYLECVLPTELSSYFAGSLTPDRYFPIYEAANNGISYVFDTNFWIQGGMNKFYRFMFAHFLFKLDLLPSQNLIPPSRGLQQLNFQYKTPVSKEFLSNILTLSDNSSGNFQVYSQLRTQNQASEGQGLKIRLSGVHLGSEWVLQYIGVDVLQLEGDNLQHFEG